MTKYLSLFVVFLILLSCESKNQSQSVTQQASNTSLVDSFVNAFYSFDRESLEAILVQAPSSHPNILYYQKWAECAHYQVVKRGDIIQKNDSLLICPITVKDDLMSSLQIDFNVTDTFHISIVNGYIRSVETSSNDPAEYYEAKEWVKMNRPQFVEKACEGIWEGGPTPCECVQGMLKGFVEFTEEKKVKR